MRKDRRAFAAAVRSRYWREEEAQVVLEDWRDSGLELEEFARRYELSPRRLRRWSERLGGDAEPELRFHPVALQVDGPTRERPASETSGVELVVPGGRRIAVEREFDEELLARVVRVVESWSC